MLYALDALVNVDLDKEESLLTLLDERLTGSEAGQFATAMAEVGAVPLPD